MGRSYWFECSKCGYRAKVSGRADRGLNCFVQTIVCRDCKELYDAVTRIRIPDEMPVNNTHLKWPGRLNVARTNTGLHRTRSSPPSFQSALNRLTYTGVKRFKWLQFKLQCPVAAFHRVQSWNDPDKCPRCGIYLDKNAIPYRIWE